MPLRILNRRIWIPREDVARHLETNKEKREEICSDIDSNGFDWQIWAVAGSGFFTDSYNLFSSNVILPSLAFVYWSTDKQSDHETPINAITLTGSLVGQLIFGYLADRFGRKRLYGVELFIVIFGTIGFVQCSAGYNNQSMSILGWILFWRFLVGVGIGAEYPLSAVITAEFAPRQSRARMMAAVFLMQPLGQLLASAVGLAVLLTVGRDLATITDYAEQAVVVDKIWRYIIGVGAIPALIAILFRLTIPESPRYTLDVDHDGVRALKDTRRYLNLRRESTVRSSSEMIESNGYNDVEHDATIAPAGAQVLQRPSMAAPAHENFLHEDGREGRHVIDGGEVEATNAYEQNEDEDDEDDDEDDDDDKGQLPDPFSRSELVKFFITEGNIKYLMATSFCWFFLDFAFYGLEINNPRVIAQLWSYEPVANATQANTTPIWENPTDSNMTIFETLKQDGIRSIITISVGSLLGSLIIIKLIDYVPRKAWLVWSFISIALLFAVAGGSYVVAANSDLHALTIVFYALCQLLFNLGPNTLTFIIPAEIFPTRYRGTCHGISAASGKLGSIIVQAFLPSILLNGPYSKSLAWVLIGFVPAMALGALFAWAWLPEVQNPRGSDEDDVNNGIDDGGNSSGRAERARRGRRRSSKKRRTINRYKVPSKSLEEMAAGRAAVQDEELKVGFRHRGRLTVRRMERSIHRKRTSTT